MKHQMTDTKFTCAKTACSNPVAQGAAVLKHGSLFSGIGGFDLAAEWMGWENVFHCEWKEFQQKILKHHFPKSISYADITKTDFTKHKGEIDIISGGFPCQPFSQAGKRKGTEDERYLWGEMLRAIREVQPSFIVAENVRGLTNWNGGMVFDKVQADMEAEGYEVLPFLLPACAVNATHRRDRIWFVAYNDKFRQNIGKRKYEINTSEGWQYAQHDIEQIILHSDITNEQRERIGKKRKGESNGSDSGFTKWNTGGSSILKSIVCRNDDGVSRKLDESRLFGLGNAIVPQVAYEIFKCVGLLAVAPFNSNTNWQ